MIEGLLGLLLMFMLVGAIVAVETRDLLSSVICVGAVGVGSSIAFLLLQAPDIAITQIVVEVLFLIILIRATIRRDLTAITGDREFFGMVTSIALLAAFVIFGIRALHFLEFGKPAHAALGPVPFNHYLKEGLRETGAANIVAAVILDYRGYDTLGEATVLFTSVIGALAILRRRARKPRGEVLARKQS